MNSEEEYKQLTAWMLTVITHPQGVHEGAAMATKKGFSSEALEAIIKPSKRLDSTERISIYQRAYYARLLECFEAEYPVLKHLLGADIFKAFVFEYLQYHPSQSYTLNQLGAKFPAYLAKTQPNQKASDSKQGTWINLILDLAKLERAYVEVYDGPGHEEEVIPNANRLLKLDLDTFAKLRLVPADCLRLFEFQHELLDYFLATKKGLAPEERPLPGQNWVALIRQQYRMRFFKLSALDDYLLRALFNGHDVNDTIIQAPLEWSKTSSVSLIAVRSRICLLAEEGFFKEAVL